MSKIIINSIILKLEDGTYFETNKVSNYRDYELLTYATIGGVYGLVVGYGIRSHVIDIKD